MMRPRRQSIMSFAAPCATGRRRDLHERSVAPARRVWRPEAPGRKKSEELCPATTAPSSSATTGSTSAATAARPASGRSQPTQRPSRSALSIAALSKGPSACRRGSARPRGRAAVERRRRTPTRPNCCRTCSTTSRAGPRRRAARYDQEQLPRVDRLPDAGRARDRAPPSPTSTRTSPPASAAGAWGRTNGRSSGAARSTATRARASRQGGPAQHRGLARGPAPRRGQPPDHGAQGRSRSTRSCGRKTRARRSPSPSLARSSAMPKEDAGFTGSCA
jgi:hypothetical protein